MKAKHFDILALIVILSFGFYLLSYAWLPHFWDEAWVYAPAIKVMAKDTPSIFPFSIPLDLSRGHPLGYHFLGSIWLKVFGVSNFSSHFYAISISLLCCLSVYYFLKLLIGVEAGFFGVLLLISQPLFFAQSFMLYPEMLLSLGLVLAMLGYFKNKVVVFVIGLIISFLSKETGLVFILAFLILDLLKVITKNGTISLLYKYVIPLAFFILYFIAVFLHYGWVFYPEHTDLISLGASDLRFQLRLVFRFLFENQNRGFWVYPIFFLSTLYFFRRSLLSALFALFLLFSFYKVFIWKWVVPIPLFWLIVVGFLFTLLYFWYRCRGQNIDDNKLNLPDFYLFTLILVSGYLLFSSINFFTPRYLLSMLIPLSSICVILIWSNKLLDIRLKYILSVLILIPGITSLIGTRNSGEINLGLFDDLSVQSRMVDWMVNYNPKGGIVCTNFITQSYFKIEEAGYVDKAFNDFIFSDICDEGCDGDYFIYTKTASFCDDGSDFNMNELQVIYTDTVNNSFATVYKKTR